MNSKKTILITVFHSFISKNILDTDVFKDLRQSDLNILLVVPNPKKNFYEMTYGGDNVCVIGINSTKLLNSKKTKFFSRLAYLLQFSHYLNYKKIERKNAKGNKIIKSIRYCFEVLATGLLAGKRPVRFLMRYFFMLGQSQKEIIGLFQSSSPAIVFSTDIFYESDVLIAREAKKRGIPTVGMIRSWDNCYSKGIMRVVPDWLIVNNETLKEEVVCMHDVNPQDVFIAGLPQFDRFVNEPRSTRQEFCQKVGLDANRPFVVIAPAGKILSDTDWQIADMLKRAKIDGRLPKIQFLIRNHPNHPADFFNFENDLDFVIENPGKVFNQNNPKETELTSLDSKHLADTLYHSSLLIYTATTLGLDALVFNKPQIIIDFDGYEKKDYWHSVSRYHDEEHMKKMIACGGVRVVSSESELVGTVREYLSDPNLDQMGRNKMLRQQLFKLDGQSGKRIVNFIKKKTR